MSSANQCRAVVVLPVALIIAIAATPLAAQQSAANVSVAAPYIATAIRAAPLAPHIDGILDDPAWADAPVMSGFVQRDPDEGQPGTERTEFQVVYTDVAIYVAVRAHDSQPDQIAAQLTRRDQYSPSDWISVQIDSYRDRRTAFEFAVNPAGVKVDRYLFDDTNSDTSWDAVWDVATSVDGGGWTAEFAIPLSQLRFSRADESVFGFNIVRDINRRNESQYWKLRPRDARGNVSLFGDLVGLRGIVPPRRVEVLPYTVMSAETSPAQEGNPFADGSSRSMTLGGDLRIGITPALTLTATVFPDFGQVEADPAVVNLSEFETFFPERRPFFNEGLDIFQFGFDGGDLFYTRRIGRAPQGSADPRGGFAEHVGQTTINAAAKLSGKTQSGWTIGLLGALTAPEHARALGGDGNEYSDLVEPRSGYFVGRLTRDLRNGQTVIGAFATAVDRGDLGSLTFLRSSAYSGGIDWNHRFANDGFSFDGKIMGSLIRGSAEAIELAQLSSARYFQRPDNDYTTFDPTRTSLSGYAAEFSFGKTSGDWRFRAGGDTRSPGFEVNDLGFQNQADNIGEWVWVQRRWLTPGKLFRQVYLNFNQWGNFTNGWDRTNTGGNINLNLTFLNYWEMGGGINRNWGGLRTTALRGGPGLIGASNWNGWLWFGSDSRKSLSASLDSWFWTQPESGSNGWGIAPFMRWRAATNMEFTFGPQLDHQLDTWQYLTAEEVAGNQEYIFGELDQTTVAMTMRGNMTFSPELSLQLYAQPFVSSGEYLGYSRVADPRGDTFADRLVSFADDRILVSGDGRSLDVTGDGQADIALGNPNFTFMSFRSNVVLRWEYNLGSTLFLVWQHGRSDFNNRGDFDLGSSITDLRHAASTNNFLVKFNYWLTI